MQRERNCIPGNGSRRHLLLIYGGHWSRWLLTLYGDRITIVRRSGAGGKQEDEYVSNRELDECEQLCGRASDVRDEASLSPG